MDEALEVVEAKPVYKTDSQTTIVGVVTGGKLRNTRTFTKSDESEGTVANWKVKFADNQVHDYVAVFDADADAFEAQIKAKEEITIISKRKSRVTVNEQGHELREPLATPELSYDAPMGDVEEMFS